MSLQIDSAKDCSGLLSGTRRLMERSGQRKTAHEADVGLFKKRPAVIDAVAHCFHHRLPAYHSEND